MLDVNRLSSVQSNKGVSFLSAGAFPGSHCPMHTALAFACRIKGLSSLVVGTPECATYSRVVVNHVGGEDDIHWTYVLDGDEVVFGCSEGLKRSLREMAEAGAGYILLIITCVPELIGEDMEGLLYELEGELSAKVVYVNLAHFKGNSYPAGAFRTLNALGKLMEERVIDDKRINVIGRSPEEDHLPMPEILNLLLASGYRMRYLGPEASLEDFLEAGDGKLNIVLSPFGQLLAKQMEKRFQIPFVDLHGAYHSQAIREKYEEISRILGGAWEDEKGRQSLAELEAQGGSLLQGLTYISGDIGLAMPLPLAIYLNYFQMKPLLLHFEEFYAEDKVYRDLLVARGEDPYVCHLVNEYEDKNYFDLLAPDIFLGNTLWTNESVVKVENLYGLYGAVGYERSILFLKKLFKEVADGTVAF